MDRDNTHRKDYNMEDDDEYMDNFSPLQHDLDEYHSELREEFADEFDK